MKWNWIGGDIQEVVLEEENAKVIETGEKHVNSEYLGLAESLSSWLERYRRDVKKAERVFVLFCLLCFIH